MGHVIVGAGGHGITILDAMVSNFTDILGEIKFLDDVRTGDRFSFPIIGDLKLLESAVLLDDNKVIIGIGDARRRREVARIADRSGALFFSAVHPASYVSRMATVGVGIFIAPHATVGANVVIGDHCIINNGAHIGHDTVIGNYASVNDGTVTGGGAQIGEAAYIGMNVSILPKVKIGAFAVVGAGSVVTRDVPEYAVVKGAPAK